MARRLYLFLCVARFSLRRIWSIWQHRDQIPSEKLLFNAQFHIFLRFVVALQKILSVFAFCAKKICFLELSVFISLASCSPIFSFYSSSTFVSYFHCRKWPWKVVEILKLRYASRSLEMLVGNALLRLVLWMVFKAVIISAIGALNALFVTSLRLLLGFLF